METNNSKYKLVLGLEIHIQAKTKTGMFCGCKNEFGAEPNTLTCPVCLGLPGALPVPNKEAVEKTHILGLALGCKLNKNSRFDRKHYFYPDLPKGYQISQYKQPLCEGGYVELDSGKKVELERIHLEEDTAKSTHENGKTLIDFNMSGTPLIELVTKPQIESAEEAGEFARKLRDLVRHLGISDAEMQKAQMRIEPNISVRTIEMAEKGELPDYKVEVKNINSFKFMERAVRYEFDRQVALLEKGETPKQENRGWDEKNNETVAQRSKEEAKDYRYFPEPDIPPMVFDDEYFEQLQKDMPELPDQIKHRLIKDHGLNEDTAMQLTTNPGIELLEKFEALVEEIEEEAQKIANLLLNKKEFRDLEPKEFADKMKSDAEGLPEDELNAAVEKVLAENQDAVESYKSGKESVLQFLLGQVMRETRGKADPETTLELIKTLAN